MLVKGAPGIPSVGSDNDRRRYIVTLLVVGWAYVQIDLCLATAVISFCEHRILYILFVAISRNHHITGNIVSLILQYHYLVATRIAFYRNSLPRLDYIPDILFSSQLYNHNFIWCGIQKNNAVSFSKVYIVDDVRPPEYNKLGTYSMKSIIYILKI